MKNTKSKRKVKRKASCKISFTPTNARKITIGVIVLAMVVVIVSVICAFFLRPEQRVKSTITALATDYYENYFHPNFTSSEKYSEIVNLSEAMQKYEENGFSAVSLRQLLLYDNQKNSGVAPFLKEYCDESDTYVKFYPSAPYDKKSYRAEYTYSCNF